MKKDYKILIIIPKKKQRRKQTSKQREDTNTVYLVIVTGTHTKKRVNRHQRNRVDIITQDNSRKDKGDRQCLDAELENSK